MGLSVGLRIDVHRRNRWRPLAPGGADRQPMAPLAVEEMRLAVLAHDADEALRNNLPSPTVKQTQNELRTRNLYVTGAQDD